MKISKKFLINYDLFFRINVLPINVFPLQTRNLSSRKDDILPIAIKILDKHSQEGKSSPYLTIEARELLLTHNWPGNVRELRNLVERITILSANETKENIDKIIEDILNPSKNENTSKNIFETSFASPLKEAREHFEKEYLITQLKKNHGNISKTADFIGKERSALHRKLKSLGIKGIN